MLESGEESPKLLGGFLLLGLFELLKLVLFSRLLALLPTSTPLLNMRDFFAEGDRLSLSVRGDLVFATDL